MLQSVPSRTSSKPRLLATLPTWTMVIVQVQAANTLFLAETDTQLMTSNDDGTVDALQILQASGIVSFWWIGDLWAAGSQAPGVAFKPFIAIPTGITTGSGQALQGAWGISPTVQPSAPGGSSEPVPWFR